MNTDPNKQETSSEEIAEFASEENPLASLQQLMDRNPELQQTFDFLLELYTDDTDDPEDQEVLVDAVEVDGKNYIVMKTVTVGENTYTYLANVKDVMDFMIQKLVVEDGEEYVTELDSKEEFDLAYAYLYREMLKDAQDRLKKKNGESAPEE